MARDPSQLTAGDEMITVPALHKKPEIQPLIHTLRLHQSKLYPTHIVPHRKFNRIGGTSSANFPNFKYVAPREICVERKCFDSPIAK